MKNKDTARILIVDDQIHALQGVSRIMGGAGYETFEASNGADCLRLAAEHKPDLILLDVVLPDIDGREVCRLIKSNPETADISVVLLSSIQVQSDSQAEALERGADGYIARPIPNRELVARVKSILKLKNAENRLRESEARYRTVADFTYSWEYWVTPEGDFLYVSPSSERISGYSAEEFISDPDLMNRIIHPDDRNMMLEHYHNMRKVIPDAVDARDFRIIRRDGAIRWIAHVCQPVYGQDGQSSGRRGSNRDITERKLAEEAVQRSEKFLEQVVENIPDMIFVKDAENLRFVRFNKAGEDLLGYSRENLLGKNDYDFFPVAQADFFTAKDRAVLTDGKLLDIPEEEIETKLKGKRTLHTKKIPIIEADGIAQFLLGISEDITERKQSEESQKLLIAAIEQAAEGVVITDATGIIQYVNPAEEKISGYSRAELIGQGADIYKSDKHHEDLHANMWENIRTGNVWQGRFSNRKKDGTEYHEDATISPIYDESGKLTNFVAVKHDVTKQITLQEQLLQAQKMEAIGTLAGGFAHDFNNKLQVIDGYVDLMLFDKDMPETAKSELEVIKQTVHSSAELIKGMMVFVRKAPMELRPIELNKLVAQTRSMLSRSMPKMIEIDLLLDDDLWTINAAPNQIDQILMNLSINARDAMPDGGRLTIKTQNLELEEEFCLARPGAKPGRYVMIAVSDTGTGMDKETASHIFEPFFTTKASGKGTGLGLAVVYGIVEQHNGWIICDSEPSVGSTFRIYFPAIEEVPQEQYFEKKEPPRGKAETILLVDDEPDLLQIIVRLLNRANYRVITSTHGKDALELYEKHRKEIRLVILDLLMPGMGGKECLRALFRMDPNSRVLMVSGYHEEGIAEKLKDAGAKGFMWKPFDEPELLEKIREIIDEE
jgi:two-component system cell cycle sensor histidine kinase/response regulator CckA